MPEQHDILPRRRTPDLRNPDGSTTVTVQRCCNGCGDPLGDATDTEVQAAIEGKPLPDVRVECPRCTTETFMDAVAAGRATVDQVDDWVDDWHKGRHPTLRSVLGLTDSEYSRWVMSAASLEAIAAERKSRQEKGENDANLRSRHGRAERQVKG